MVAESSSLAGQPVDPAPTSSSGNRREWTPGFTLLTALIILPVAAAAVFGVSGIKPAAHIVIDFTSIRQAELAVRGVFIGVFLVGLWSMKDRLLRVSFLLQAVVSAIALVPILTSLHLVSGAWTAIFFSTWYLLLVPAAGLMYQILFSYGLVRWQPSDRVFVVIQLLLTLGLGIVLARNALQHLNGADLLHPHNVPLALLLSLTLNPFLGIAGLVCLLVRAACWKAHPFLMVCFTAGSVASFLYELFFARMFTAGMLVQQEQVSFGISFAGSLLFLIGLLVLIRTEQVHEQLPQAHVAETSGV